MDSDREREIGIHLRTTQILVMALVLGSASFFAVVAILALTHAVGMPATGGLPLPALGCVLAALAVFSSFAVKSLLLHRARKQAQGVDEAASLLLPRYRVAHIVAGALCEGGALAVGIFVLVGGPGSLPWLAGGLISFLGFALHFPTREKLDAFLAESRR